MDTFGRTTDRKVASANIDAMRTNTDPHSSVGGSVPGAIARHESRLDALQAHEIDRVAGALLRTQVLFHTMLTSSSDKADVRVEGRESRDLEQSIDASFLRFGSPEFKMPL